MMLRRCWAAALKRMCLRPLDISGPGSIFRFSQLPGSPSYTSICLHVCVVFPPQIQFFLTLCHTVSAVIWPCGFPMGWLYFLIGYMISLILLFSNFYLQVGSCFFCLFWVWFGLGNEKPGDIFSISSKGN